LWQPAIETAIAKGSRANRPSLKRWLIFTPPFSLNATHGAGGKTALY
jgi:hypothetical protein